MALFEQCRESVILAPVMRILISWSGLLLIGIAAAMTKSSAAAAPPIRPMRRPMRSDDPESCCASALFESESVGMGMNFVISE